MKITNHVIVNDRSHKDDALMYWSIDLGWVEDFGLADTFDKEIINYPLPTGAGGVMQVDIEGRPMGFYPVNNVYKKV